MRRGFTLVELLIVLAVLAIIFTLGFGGLRSYYQTVRLREASQALAQALKRVGTLALTSSEPYHLTLTPNSGELSWTADSDTNKLKLVTATLPYGATLLNAVDAVGNPCPLPFKYIGRGMPEVGCTFTIELNGKPSLVTVLPTGKVILP